MKKVPKLLNSLLLRLRNSFAGLLCTVTVLKYSRKVPMHTVNHKVHRTKNDVELFRTGKTLTKMRCNLLRSNGAMFTKG